MISSDFMAAYRRRCSKSHVFIRVIENPRKALGNSSFTGAILMDLLKVFDCVPQDLLNGKFHTYGLIFETVTFIYSYLKERKQNVKISNT